MTTRTDVEQLLARIPLSTPTDESNASTLLQTFVALRNAAFEGGGVALPPVLAPLAVPDLLRQMREGNYGDVAVTLIGLAGDAASAFSLLVSAGVQLGTFPALGGLASAGMVATALAEAAGPAMIAASVLVATFAIPADVNQNNTKLFFIADASGILTSWIFNLPAINPHARLLARARTGGYFRADVSQGCRLAHERVHQLWQTTYRGNATAVRAARESVGNSWERYWRQVGNALEQRLVPLPHGMGAGWVNTEVADAARRMRLAEHAAATARLAERRRRAAGGYWFRTAEGIELFMPDT
jgi:hypothetical protein